MFIFSVAVIRQPLPSDWRGRTQQCTLGSTPQQCEQTFTHQRVPVTIFQLLYILFSFRNSRLHDGLLNDVASDEEVEYLKPKNTYDILVKGNAFLVHATKAHRGNGSSIQPIPNIGIRWRCAVNFTILHLNPLKMKLRLLYLKTQSVPRSKHFSSRL